MSYDLFFKPRSGEVASGQVADYFRARRHYEVNDVQALYQNEDTGVYFCFDLQNDTDEAADASCPVALNVNYFRPSFFGLEAEPEVGAFVSTFDMIVSDPQIDGMGEGDYNGEKFLSGWNQGNEFAYSAMLREPGSRNSLVSYPAAKLLQAWSWNKNRQQLQNEFGKSLFVPKVMFILVAGQPRSVAVWPDGIPIATTEVDLLFVQRKELAPRRFLRRIEDQTLLSWNDALPILKKHQSQRSDGIIALKYDTPHQDVQKFIEALPADERNVEGVAADSVLDQELVEKYAT